MTKIETTAEVSDNHRLTVDVDVPDQVTPGRHRVVVMIEPDSRFPKNRELRFSAYPVGLISDESTFRREKLIGDDGR